MATIVWADYETYWDANYTLRDLTPAEYILDPRFEALGSGFIIDGGESFWVDGPDLPAFYAEFNWDDTVVITHNALFDACILAWRYGVKPKLLGDTLAMARSWCYHKTGSVSLATLARHYGLPPKWDTTKRFKGKRLCDIKTFPEMYAELVLYGCDDTEKCQFLWGRMLKEGFPIGQLEVIDMQIRMATQPRFVADQDGLWSHLRNVMQKKDELIASCGVDRDVLMSNEKFAVELERRGVEPPIKLSKTTGEMTWAFAKTDKALAELEEHDDPDVQALVAARVGIKSTLEESRTKRFIAIAQLNWPDTLQPSSLPIPLRYSGAHTHRFSGDWYMNAQNLPRWPNDELRLCLKAPPGFKVVSCDLSQVEARITATLAGQTDLMAAFADKDADVYCNFASLIYNRTITKADKIERTVGKHGILSLGYGASWRTFQNMVRNMSKREIQLDDEECERIVHLYRSTYTDIRNLWYYCDDLIHTIARGETRPFGPITIKEHTALLPSGHRLRYNELRQVQNKETGRMSWVYRYGNQLKYLYGAKVVENFVQSLAFCVIMEAAIRIKRMFQDELQLVHQVHDELIYIVPESVAEALKDILVAEIAKPPVWLPNAPLAAEGGVGDSYGDC